MNKKRLIVIAAILIVAVASAGVAYAFDLFKSPKQIYLEAEAKEFKTLNDNLSKAFDQYNEELKPYLEGSVHSKQEISVEADGNFPPDPTVKIALDILKQSKIVVDSYSDTKNEQSDAKLDLVYNGSNLVGAEVFADKDKMGLAVPAIYKNYLTFDLKDRDKLKEKFGIQTLPKKMITYQDYIDALKIPKSEYEPILKEYAKLYVDNLNDNQVTMTKGKLDEANLDARIITVTYTEAEYKDLVKKFGDKLANDDKLAELLYNRIDKLAKLYEDAGYQGISLDKPKDAAQVKEELKKFADEMNQSLEDQDLSQGVKMVVYVDSKDNILDRKITVGDGEKGSTLRFANWTDKDKKQTKIFSVNNTQKSGDTSNLEVVYTNKPEDKTNKGTFNITTKEKVSGSEKTVLEFKSDFTLTKDGAKHDGQYNFSFSTDEMGQNDKLAGEFKTSSTKNDKDKSQNGDASLKLNIEAPSEALKLNLGLNIKTSIEFGKGVELPKLDSSNSVNVADMSEQDMMQLSQDVQLGAQQLLMKLIASNQDLARMFMQ